MVLSYIKTFLKTTDFLQGNDIGPKLREARNKTRNYPSYDGIIFMASICVKHGSQLFLFNICMLFYFWMYLSRINSTFFCVLQVFLSKNNFQTLKIVDNIQ